MVGIKIFNTEERYRISNIRSDNKKIIRPSLSANQRWGIMDAFKALISDNPNPVIIFDKADRKIVQANDKFMSYSGEIIGQEIDDILKRVQLRSFPPKTFIGDTWFDIVETPFTVQGSEYIKLTLKKPENVVDDEHIAIIKKMIATLLHRFRSPLTGMQGYVDFLQPDIIDKKLSVRLNKINCGINYLFDIMDELEKLHDVSPEAPNDDVITDSGSLINKILLTYNPEVQSRINIENFDSFPSFSCAPFPLERIFSALIENAVEHSESTKGAINIRCDSQSITITNDGGPIPDNISNQLFYPFVTTKACNLGIGLTLAQLYAKQISGLLFLSNNSTNNISFTLYHSPHRNNGVV